MGDKTSRAVVLKPNKTSSLLVCGVLCFSQYTNFQGSRKHHCYELS